jgi:MSHA biogenesis protein MshO
VTYGCSGGNLFRVVSSAYPLVPPTSCPSAGQVLATNVLNCNFDYSGSDLQRNASLRLTISFSSGGEAVNLYHEVHVNNTP